MSFSTVRSLPFAALSHRVDATRRPWSAVHSLGVVVLLLLVPLAGESQSRGAVPPGGVTIVADGSTCTLADAIRAANTGGTVGGCTGSSFADVIVLDADVSLTVPETTDSTSLRGAYAGLPDIVSEIEIEAGSAARIERSSALGCTGGAADAFRLFNVLLNGALTLRGLTLTGGCVADVDQFGDASGGAILVFKGALSLDGVTVRDNRIRVDGTALAIMDGGALYCKEGSMGFIADSVFETNEARGPQTGATRPAYAAGGAAHLALCPVGDIERTSFVSNLAISSADFAATSHGGAFYVRSGTIDSLQEVRFVDNLARGGDVEANNTNTFGGALYIGSNMTIPLIANSEFRGNEARAGDGGGVAAGGAIAHHSGLIEEIVATIFEGNEATGGAADDDEPGPAYGGAISVRFGEIQAIRDTWFHRNRVVGGTTTALGGDSLVGGGAIYVRSGGMLSLIERVTFSENEAIAGVGPAFPAHGGAIASHRDDVGIVTNSTFVANRAVGGQGNGPTEMGSPGLGGAWYVDNSNSVGTREMRGNTFVANEARGGAGQAGNGDGLGGALYVLGDALFSGNLLTGNFTGSGGAAGVLADCDDDGNLVSDGWNRVEVPNTCAFSATGDVVGAATSVYPLGDWGCTTLLPDGGCVPTVAIDQASAAVDASSCVDVTLADDARAALRPFDLPAVTDAAGSDACDIGAFEAVDSDGDGYTEAADCSPDDALVFARDVCGVCDGDGSACRIFENGFETGDTSGWS